jgi:RNA polymerase sigma-70 factor, ECF subfamily
VTEERELVQRMLAGDQAAFTEFFESHFARLFRFALPRVSGDEDAAKEVVQRTLIKVMRKLHQFRGDATLFTWSCQICRREVVDHARATRRSSSNVVLFEDSAEVRAALESIAAPASEDPLARCDRAELARMIRVILDQLPARYGDALEWKYMEGRSVEEIGERLGIGHTAAQSLLARARVAFRQGLEGVFGASAPDVVAALER